MVKQPGPTWRQLGVPRPDGRLHEDRRRQVAVLRAQGHSMRQISEQLGVSKQAVSYLSKPHRPGIRCAGCGAVVTTRRLPRRTVGRVLCRACLTARSDVSFGLRLRSLRVAAALSRADLAGATGLEDERLKGYEEETATPHRVIRALLAKVLDSPDLEQLCNDRG